MDSKNSLFVEERKERILELLNEQAKVLVPELCEEFGVSQVTVRNDLRELEAQGKLRRTHGGAIPPSQASYEPVSREKAVVHIESKQRIAQKAMQLVQDGDTIALDTGSTMIEFAKCLVERKDLSVVTNDIQLAMFLEEHGNNTRIVLTGGLMRRGQHCAVGPIALRSLQGLNVDKVFMATNAFSVESGFTTPNLEQAEIKKRLMEIARERIMLADSSKAGRVSFVQFADLDSIDKLITDCGLPLSIRQDLETQADHMELFLV